MPHAQTLEMEKVVWESTELHKKKKKDFNLNPHEKLLDR